MTKSKSLQRVFLAWLQLPQPNLARGTIHDKTSSTGVTRNGSYIGTLSSSGQPAGRWWWSVARPANCHRVETAQTRVTRKACNPVTRIFALRRPLPIQDSLGLGAVTVHALHGECREANRDILRATLIRRGILNPLSGVGDHSLARDYIHRTFLVADPDNSF
jgi:hypothetical protein